MKILHIIPSLDKGGAERLTLDIVKNLMDVPDVEVALVIFRNQNSYSFLTDAINFHIIPSFYTPSIKGKGKVDVKDLQNFIDTFQPTIIHSHLFETEIVLSRIKLSKDVKRIVHFHDNMHQLRKVKFKKVLEKSTLTNYYERKIVLKSWSKHQTQTIAISKDTEEYIAKNIPKKFKSTFLKNGINVKRFENNGGVTKENRLVIIGSLVDKKGQQLAIETIAELVKRRYDYKLDILGNGKDFNKLSDLINALNLNEHVTLHGNVDYPETFLHKAKIYLHTAKYEPFGLVILEAMAAGLPVVCTDGYGNRDLIKEGKNGFMVKDRSPALLADKIELLMQNEPLRIQMGDFANRYSHKFDISVYTKELMSLYLS
jgi:glycosyltransferase involved in cell wall biosynthesis